MGIHNWIGLAITLRLVPSRAVAWALSGRHLSSTFSGLTDYSLRSSVSFLCSRSRNLIIMAHAAVEDRSSLLGSVKSSAQALLAQWHILLFLFLGALVPNLNLDPYLGDHAQTVKNICQVTLLCSSFHTDSRCISLAVTLFYTMERIGGVSAQALAVCMFLACVQRGSHGLRR